MLRKIVCGLWIIAAFLVNGCAQANEIYTAEGVEEPKAFLKGVSLSPRSYQGDDFLDFIEQVDETQDILLWAGDWMELHDETAPIIISALAEQNNFIPVVEVGHFIQESGELFRPLNEENRSIYLESTTAFVSHYEPEYFGIGVEVNIFAEKNPQDFEEFVIFYAEVYKAIKEISPTTKVFTVYQLETLKGLNFWTTEVNEPRWGMLKRFEADIIAFTTYPGLVYKDPVDIPGDYYVEILQHTDKPVAFMEIGWHSASSPAGWESSEDEQARFAVRFFELTKGLDLEAAVWSFMYDPDSFEPFSSMGLIREDGTIKPVWDVWVEAEGRND